MTIEWVIGISLMTLLAGVGFGYLLGGGKQQQKRVRQLKSDLEQSRTEHGDYKRAVFEQFADTADKFHALDKSYRDLHRQLAASSVALCGDDATRLLGGPEQSQPENAPGFGVEENDVTAEVRDSPAEDALADLDADAGLVTTDEIVVSEAAEVPVLTELEGEDSAQRRDIA